MDRGSEVEQRGEIEFGDVNRLAKFVRRGNRLRQPADGADRSAVRQRDRGRLTLAQVFDVGFGESAVARGSSRRRPLPERP